MSKLYIWNTAKDPRSHQLRGKRKKKTKDGRLINPRNQLSNGIMLKLCLISSILVPNELVFASSSRHFMDTTTE